MFGADCSRGEYQACYVDGLAINQQLERADKERGWPVRPDRAVAPSEEQKGAVLKWLRAKEGAGLPDGSDDRPPEDPQLAAALAGLREVLKGAK